ncbi:MAG TPA: hypothetical protein VM869_21135 [Enhygromyxa sp.]|nr:hypothetical protein [Enhygromyxa sp.]
MSEDHGGVARVLIDALAQEGRFVDDGAFTLDPSKAREKLRAYQLVNAHAYILLLVESAAIAGASAIDISCGRASVAEFMGVSLTRAQLENVFTSVFLDTDALTGEAQAAARIQQLLGVAANAALSLGPERIEIENVDAEGRLNRMTITTDGAYACETVGEGPRGRTRFVVTDGRESDRDDREVALIRERCRYASFAVNLYGQRMSAGPRRALLGLRTERVRLDDGSVIGLAGRRPEPEPAKLLLVTRGVLAETITLEDGRSGFVAVVDVDLRKDLSQRGVLRGEPFDRVMRAVMRVHDLVR